MSEKPVAVAMADGLLETMSGRAYPAWAVVSVMLIGFGCLVYAGYDASVSVATAISGRTLLFVGMGGFLVLISAIMSASRRRLVEELSDRASLERVDEAAEATFGHKGLDLPDLMNFTRVQVNEYHEQTKRRANQSFVWAQFSAGVGLLLLIGGGILAMSVRREGVATGIVTGLSALGTVLATYISRTHLLTHRLSLNQLNHYFNQPVVTYQILQAERLATDLGEEEAALKAQIAQVLLQIALDINAASLPTQTLVKPATEPPTPKLDALTDGHPDGKTGAREH